MLLQHIGINTDIKAFEHAFDSIGELFENKLFINSVYLSKSIIIVHVRSY